MFKVVGAKMSVRSIVYLYFVLHLFKILGSIMSIFCESYESAILRKIFSLTSNSCHKSAPKSCGLSDLGTLANLVSLASLNCLVWLVRLASSASLASLACLNSPVSLTDETGICQDLFSNHVGMADMAGLAGYTIINTISIDRPVKLFRQA